MQNRPSHPFRSFVSTIAALATILAPYAALVPVAHAASLFSDGFESTNFSAWTVSNGNWTNLNGPAAYSGSRRAGVQGNTSIPDPSDDVLGVSISTLGYDNVVLTYAARIADNLEPGQGDHVSVEWSVGGAPWFPIRNFTGAAGGWAVYTDSLPVGAADQSDLRIRFSAHLGAANDQFYLDEVSLTGDLLPPPTPDCSGSSTFDSFTTGSVNGQGGWSSTGAYDQAVVTNTYGYPTFGCQSLRLSNAVTSGAFGDQTFSFSNTDEAGETDSTNGGQSGGTRQRHFEAQFDLASTMQDQQAGLAISVSPDRGDGSRMSYLRFDDAAGGVDVTFYDVQGVDNPANFVATTVATGLSRATPHTVKFVIDYVDGLSNDVVNVYIDGSLVHTGTTWENYYRFDSEASAEQSPRTTDSLLFRAGGAAAPATSGSGFLFDNIEMSSSVPLTAPTGTLVVQKVIVGGDAAFEDFSFKLDGSDPITFEEDGTNTFIEQAPGTSNVFEIADPDYITTYGEDCDESGNVVVVAGETVTCVVTNTRAPSGTLTVYKVLSGDIGDAQISDFSFSVGPNGPYAMQEGGTQVTIAPGTYSVVEQPNAYSDYGTVSYSGDCDSDGGTIVVADEGVYTCTITNTLSVPAATATIHVVKNTVGGNGSFGFSLSGNEESDHMDIQTVDSEGTADFIVHPGDGASYTVTEDAAPGWDLTLAPDCEYDNQEVGIVAPRGYTVELDADDEVTCTFTNTWQSASPTPTPTAHITVIKQTEGGDGEFSFDGPEEEAGFTISTEGGSGSEVLGVSPNGDGTTYTIGENVPDGWTLEGFVCEYDGEPEESPSPSPSPSPSESPSPSPSPSLNILEDPFNYGETSVEITLQPGDDVTCTFTNSTDGGGNEGGSGHDSGPASATLIIEKIIVGGADASVSFSDFSFSVGGDSYQFEEDGSNKLKLHSGDYTVVEDAFAGAEATYSGDCDEQGNVSMVSDETYTCTITNTFAVGGFNPGEEPGAPDSAVPSIPPTPTPTPGGDPTGSSGPNGSNGGTLGGQNGDGAGESPSPSASPSADDTALTTAAIGNLANLPCVPGGVAWAVLNLVIYLLTTLWLQRGPFSWLRALLLLAVATALLSWYAAACGNDPQWLPGVLGLVSLIWIRLRRK